jgi:GTPase SAR1 family protein
MYNVQKEINKANIIILVFDITRPETLKRITAFWLPLISSISEIPCILVGNKIDLPKSSKNLEEISKEITKSYPQSQIAIEITAKSYISIAKLFQIAEQSVIFPTNSLYNPTTYELTDSFVRALKLIFRLSDKDGDMRLNAEELERFNKDVYEIDLTSRDVEKIKMLIKDTCPDGIDHVGITLNGFIAINKIFIKKLKSNNSWKMLEYFGFDQSLERNFNSIVELPRGHVIELSNKGINFLQTLFYRYCVHDILTESQLEEIFSTVKNKPWEPEDYKALVHTIDGGIPLHSWVSLWQLLVFNSHTQALNCLASLGYYEPIDSTVEVFSKSAVNKRRVLVCSVTGYQNVGKKMLIRRFLYKNSNENVSNCVCNTLNESENVLDSKYLILTKKEDKISDVVCMVYDGSNASINFIKKLVIDEAKPRILLLNKNDFQEHDSAYSFSLELGLRECPQFCLKNQRPNSLFKLVKDYAVEPQKGSIRRGKIRSQPNNRNFINGWTAISMGIVVLGYFVARKALVK